MYWAQSVFSLDMSVSTRRTRSWIFIAGSLLYGSLPVRNRNFSFFRDSHVVRYSIQCSWNRYKPSVAAMIAIATPRRPTVGNSENVTEFLLEAGINAAEDALVDRRMFRLDDRQWQAFQAILDRPVADKPRLTRLLAEKSVLE